MQLLDQLLDTDAAARTNSTMLDELADLDHDAGRWEHEGVRLNAASPFLFHNHSNEPTAASAMRPMDSRDPSPPPRIIDTAMTHAPMPDAYDSGSAEMTDSDSEEEEEMEERPAEVAASANFAATPASDRRTRSSRRRSKMSRAPPRSPTQTMMPPTIRT